MTESIDTSEDMAQPVPAGAVAPAREAAERATPEGLRAQFIEWAKAKGHDVSFGTHGFNVFDSEPAQFAWTGFLAGRDAAAALVRPMAGEGARDKLLLAAEEFDGIADEYKQQGHDSGSESAKCRAYELREIARTLAATPQVDPTPQEIRRAEDAAELTRVCEPQAVRRYRDDEIPGDANDVPAQAPEGVTLLSHLPDGKGGIVSINEAQAVQQMAGTMVNGVWRAHICDHCKAPLRQGRVCDACGCGDYRFADLAASQPQAPAAGGEFMTPEQELKMYRDFWWKHHMPRKLAPSCLCCGKTVNDPAIRHMELPNVVVCFACRDSASAPAAGGEPVGVLMRGEGSPWVGPLGFDDANLATLRAVPEGAKLYTTPQPAPSDVQDAARFHWLLEQQDVTWQTNEGQWSGCNGLSLREAIDAAITKETP